MANSDSVTEGKRVHGENVTLGPVREEMCLHEKPHREARVLFFANRSKLKRHTKAVKQYLTRKEWRREGQSCTLEGRQERTHRTKKGLRETEREKQNNI